MTVPDGDDMSAVGAAMSDLFEARSDSAPANLPVASDGTLMAAFLTEQYRLASCAAVGKGFWIVHHSGTMYWISIAVVQTCTSVVPMDQ